ncbi:MAG: 4-(cytidine 5'-diphospho)-2-C-methyl-D-erythritol kinase [Elusimicrobiota bacterium]
MKIKAWAKVNLFLEVIGKRKDGYHNLRSIFARISLCDDLEVRRVSSPGINLKIENRANFKPIPKEKNLAYKAADSFCRAFAVKPAFEIKIVKRIPAGAGLGGGSADCAAVLKALAKLSGLRTEKREVRKKLFALASVLGADVPFFLSGEKLAVCSLKGGRIRPLPVLATLPGLLIVWPDAFVPTPEVYRNFSPGDREGIKKNLRILKGFERKLSSRDGFDFSAFLFNRLENGAFKIAPVVEKTKEILSARTGGCALMTGSGGAVFALSYNRPFLASLKKEISSLHKFIFLAEFI